MGLALAAGMILSGIWGFEAGLIASIFGFSSDKYVSAIITGIIILLPSMILMFHGSSYKTLVGRTVGAFLFTVFAMALLISPLANVWVPEGAGLGLFDKFSALKDAVISIGLIAAVVDMFLIRFSDDSKKRR